MHYASHLRDAFNEWVDEGMPETARLEVDYVEVEWPARKFLGRFVHCTDVMPRLVCDELDMEPGSSYAQAAQALLRERRAVAEGQRQRSVTGLKSGMGAGRETVPRPSRSPQPLSCWPASAATTTPGRAPTRFRAQPASP